MIWVSGWLNTSESSYWHQNASHLASTVLDGPVTWRVNLKELFLSLQAVRSTKVILQALSITLFYQHFQSVFYKRYQSQGFTRVINRSVLQALTISLLQVLTKSQSFISVNNQSFTGVNNHSLLQALTISLIQALTIWLLTLIYHHCC